MPAPSTGMQQRVVIVEGLWPNHAFEEGIGINLLTSADPGLPGGGAVFHDTSVWLGRREQGVRYTTGILASLGESRGPLAASRTLIERSRAFPTDQPVG